MMRQLHHWGMVAPIEEAIDGILEEKDINKFFFTLLYVISVLVLGDLALLHFISIDSFDFPNVIRWLYLLRLLP